MKYHSHILTHLLVPGGRLFSAIPDTMKHGTSAQIVLACAIRASPPIRGISKSVIIPGREDMVSLIGVRTNGDLSSLLTATDLIVLLIPFGRLSAVFAHNILHRQSIQILTDNLSNHCTVVNYKQSAYVHSKLQ